MPRARTEQLAAFQAVAPVADFVEPDAARFLGVPDPENSLPPVHVIRRASELRWRTEQRDEHQGIDVPLENPSRRQAPPADVLEETQQGQRRARAVVETRAAEFAGQGAGQQPGLGDPAKFGHGKTRCRSRWSLVRASGVLRATLRHRSSPREQVSGIGGIDGVRS